MPPEKLYKVIDRHIMFFAIGEEVTEIKLKKFFTDHAISEFIKYGYIKRIL